MSVQKILLIEDMAEIRDLLEVFFKRAGFDVIQADKGLRGVDLARQEKPEAALVDMRLSDIDGLEILRRIRKFDASMKIFILSGFCTDDVEKDAFAQGATACLRKGSSMEEVVGTVSAALRGRTASDA